MCYAKNEDKANTENTMDEQKQRIIDSIRQANNVLITVKNSPSIDQLAACIALTLIINELGKHGTAVFSGRVPSVLEFLEPEKTIERNTDSLRDFIISLDKAKADKLRYKVEDKVVKIFITPYKTSLSGSDLEFGQGDFNVDVVIALGVHEQTDLDEAITAHGRILHDATVVSLNTSGEADQNLGSLNWTDSQVSSLSELVAGIADLLGNGKSKDKDGDDKNDSDRDHGGSDKPNVIDNQVATALLTGIVAETERFGNAKTSPATMEVAAKLLAAGANQELVATKLAEPEVAPVQDSYAGDSGNDLGGQGGAPAETVPDNSYSVNENGELSIEHTADEPAPTQSTGPVEPNNAWTSPPSDIGYAPPKDKVPPASQPYDDDLATAVAEPTPAWLTPASPAPTPNPSLDSNSGPSEAPAPGEDQDALDFLKEHKVEPANARTLQPLHDQFHLEGLPKLGPAKAAPLEEAAAEEKKDEGNYTYNAPTMGGTLTANMPTEDEDAPTVPASSSVPPILHHGRSVDSATPALSATPLDDEPTPVSTPYGAPSEPVSKPTAGESPKLEAAPASDAGAFQTSVAAPAEPVIDAAPVTPATAHQIEAAPLDSTDTADTSTPHGTLAELESQVHSSHVEGTANQGGEPPKLEAAPADESVPQGPVAGQEAPAGAMTMPAPSSIKLPSPQLTSTTDRSQTSPLAPPPPVPPPISPL